jgi:hypothetical protein
VRLANKEGFSAVDDSCVEGVTEVLVEEEGMDRVDCCSDKGGRREDV